MGKIYENKLTDFSKGITSEPRLEDFRYARLIKGFDAHFYPHKLVPLRDSESGDTAPSTSQKQNFCLAIRTGTTWCLYSLGVKSGAATAEILMKTIGTGIDATDFDDAGWNTPANNQASSGSTSFGLFVYYKYTTIANSRIFGASGGTRIWSFDPTSVQAFDDTGHNLTHTNIAQGLVHSKDDILYIPYDNKIAKNNQGNWTDVALTLPAYLKITSISEYGNYLAIACAPLSGYGNSRVYLWDRDASLTTLSESIDWGEGVLQILEEIDGILIGISYISGFKARVVIKSYPKIFESIELTSEAIADSDILPIAKQKINNKLYFLMNLTINGVEQNVLYKFGKVNGSYALVLDRPANNNTAIQTIVNFIVVNAAGEYVFFAYTASSAYALSKTNDQAAYTTYATYESLIFNGNDSGKTKKLISAGVMTEPLPADGSVVLKYKKDAETSWTTIFTYTTDDGIYHEAINIESSGATLPEFRELQFQIISTGGAVITGLKFKYEEITKGLTD